MRRIISTKFLFLFSIFIMISCSKDSDNAIPTETSITTSDFSITMDENPENGQIIGAIIGETNEGSISFSIIEQSPESAFSIDASTGELKVADATLFNFEVNPIITGTVKVANGTLFEIATVTINLNDLEEDRPYEGDVHLASQNEVNDFGNAAYTRITGRLFIGNSSYDDIEDLTPLLNIEKIEDALIISGCSNLTNTAGLKNISHIGGYLTFNNNPMLEEIEGLSKLPVLEGISIMDNLSLNNISGFDQLFEIRGSLEIFDSQIKNLNAFENLNQIGGELTIAYNFELTDLEGLSNLNRIGDKITIGRNDLLINVDGLANVTSTVSKLEISHNLSLKNIDGLHNIEITEFLTINSNYSLKNLDGLSNTLDIRKIEITKNNSLLNLNGLYNVSHVRDLGLVIEQNNLLANLNGLGGINQIEGQLSIQKNSLLRDFCILQDFLLNGTPGSYTVKDNFYNPTIQDIIDGNCSI